MIGHIKYKIAVEPSNLICSLCLFIFVRNIKKE
jgi:hypothetical protein